MSIRARLRVSYQVRCTMPLNSKHQRVLEIALCPISMRFRDISLQASCRLKSMVWLMIVSDQVPQVPPYFETKLNMARKLPFLGRLRSTCIVRRIQIKNKHPVAHSLGRQDICKTRDSLTSIPISRPLPNVVTFSLFLALPPSHSHSPTHKALEESRQPPTS